MTTARTTDHPIDARFANRWSPRAFDPQPISAAQLASLFEAARWAPSCFNSQPWRFVYAHRDSADWGRLLGLLMPMNQAWAQNASTLIFACSCTELTPPGGTAAMPNPTHSFDTGAAWIQLALQAQEMGMITHAMAGFDRDRAPGELGLPETYRVDAAIAVGWPGDVATLPEAMQAREAPSGRNAVESFAFEGRFVAAE